MKSVSCPYVMRPCLVIKTALGTFDSTHEVGLGILWRNTEAGAATGCGTEGLNPWLSGYSNGTNVLSEMYNHNNTRPCEPQQSLSFDQSKPKTRKCLGHCATGWGLSQPEQEYCKYKYNKPRMSTHNCSLRHMKPIRTYVWL